jgi:hypothetical protein
MAMTPQPEGSTLDQAFVADRAMNWHRFTNLVKYGAIFVVCILLFLLIFIY